MEIKTIMKYCPDDAAGKHFDEQVNKCLAEGWRLTRREIFKSDGACYDLLYAELTKN